MAILRNALGLASLAASVSAHGFVQGIIADGTYYQGYHPNFQYKPTAPSVAGWSDPKNLDNGYIAPSAFAGPDIICHLSATPGTAAATVAAGGTVELQWNKWPESHHGPVLDYLAPVSAKNWSDINKTTLSFIKISERGLIDGSSSPGKWASDQLIANNNSWIVTIPHSLAPGKYVLRHEIIALHSASQHNGAQNYPQCVNLEITGRGTARPAGEAATAFYKTDDAGISINIYTTAYSYKIPGPTLWSGAAAAAASQTEVAIIRTPAASSVVVVAASTNYIPTSIPATTSAKARTPTSKPHSTSSNPTIKPSPTTSHTRLPPATIPKGHHNHSPHRNASRTKPHHQLPTLQPSTAPCSPGASRHPNHCRRVGRGRDIGYSTVGGAALEDGGLAGMC